VFSFLFFLSFLLDSIPQRHDGGKLQSAQHAQPMSEKDTTTRPPHKRNAWHPNLHGLPSQRNSHTTLSKKKKKKVRLTTEMLEFGRNSVGKRSHSRVSIEHNFKLGSQKIIQVACGGAHCAFLTGSPSFLFLPLPLALLALLSCSQGEGAQDVGSVFVWGDGRSGQLGLGFQERERQHPTIVQDLALKKVVQIECGLLQTAAITGNAHLALSTIHRKRTLEGNR